MMNLILTYIIHTKSTPESELEILHIVASHIYSIISEDYPAVQGSAKMACLIPGLKSITYCTRPTYRTSPPSRVPLIYRHFCSRDHQKSHPHPSYRTLYHKRILYHGVRNIIQTPKASKTHTKRAP